MAHRQLGFTLYLVIALAVMALGLAILGKLYFNELKSHAKTQGEYLAFQAGVRKIGEEQERKNVEERKRSEKVSGDRIKSLQARELAARARADGLCRSAGLSSGCRELSGVPETARPVDDKARDQRLLEVLRHSQDQTDRLIELQSWVTDQLNLRR